MIQDSQQTLTINTGSAMCYFGSVQRLLKTLALVAYSAFCQCPIYHSARPLFVATQAPLNEVAARRSIDVRAGRHRHCRLARLERSDVSGLCKMCFLERLISFDRSTVTQYSPRAHDGLLLIQYYLTHQFLAARSHL